MKISTSTLFIALFANPALAHVDAPLHSHGVAPGAFFAVSGLVLATAAAAWLAISR